MTENVLTLRTVDAVDVHLVRAGIGSRAYAFLIDWHIRTLAALTWFLIGIFFFGAEFRTASSAMVYGFIVPSAAIYLLYHPVLEIVMRGRTPGKRWIHLRVVTPEGATPSVGALLIRNVFRLLDSLPALYALGLLVMFCTRDQLRVGDLAAGTLVVYDAPPDRDRLAAAAVIDERMPPRVAQLLEEWLERWDEIEPQQRDGIARALLAKTHDAALSGAARGLDGVALRQYIRGIVHAVA